MPNLLQDAPGRGHLRRRVRPASLLLLLSAFGSNVCTLQRYFDDILKTTSSFVESVTVEPDGTWRASGDSAAPRSTSVNPTNADLKGKQRASEALTIDSDDDDSPPRRKAFASGSTNPGVKRAATRDVIDLTEDSDEDDGPPLAALIRVPPPTAPQAQPHCRAQLVLAQQQRVAAEAAAAEASRKKVRVEGECQLPTPRRSDWDDDT